MAFIRKGSQYKVGDVYYSDKSLNWLSEGVLEQGSVIKLVAIKGDSKFLFEDMESHEIFTLSEFEIDSYLVNISSYSELFSTGYASYNLFSLLSMLSHCIIERKSFIQAKFYAFIFTPVLLVALTLFFFMILGLSKGAVIFIGLAVMTGILETIALIELFRSRHALDRLKESDSECFDIAIGICTQDITAFDCVLDLL